MVCQRVAWQLHKGGLSHWGACHQVSTEKGEATIKGKVMQTEPKRSKAQEAQPVFEVLLHLAGCQGEPVELGGAGASLWRRSESERYERISVK